MHCRDPLPRGDGQAPSQGVWRSGKSCVHCTKYQATKARVTNTYIHQEADLRNTASIEESVRHSDIVYNLIGRDYTTKNFDFEDVHVDGAHRIAEAVAKYDVDRFVHVSSLSAFADSPSEFYRTKARGEQVVREVFPETTIVRPAPMFGFEDKLLHRLAKPGSL